MGYAYEEQVYQLTIPEILELERERVAWGNKEFRTTEESIRDYSGIGDKPTMRLNNIVVSLDAPDTEDTILFMAHTDSVKMGPGAYDDTVSVAALLEGLRQLRSKTPARDLVFLFTDGEEQGLLGAAKFMQDNQHLKDKTRLVINLEARGNRGALLMFETTDNNLNMVREYVKGAGSPVSLSIATAVYRTMQNDTDLTRFMMEGYPGLNFAAIQGAEVYHMPEDNIEYFDRVSAAHYLQTVTGLANHFALADTVTLEAELDGVFFPLTPGRVVVLSRTAADVLAWAAPVLYLLVLGWMLAKRRARLGTVLLTALWQALSMGIAYGLGMVIVRLVLNAQGLHDYRDILGYAQGETVFALLLALFSVISWALMALYTRKRARGISEMLGALLLPAVLSTATTVVFPSATYLFSLTVLTGLLVVLIHPTCVLGFAHALWMFLVLLLFVPLAALVYIALSFQSAHPELAAAMLPATLVLAFTLPGAGGNPLRALAPRCPGRSPSPSGRRKTSPR